MTKHSYAVGGLCVLATMAGVVTATDLFESKASDQKPMKGGPPMATKLGKSKFAETIERLLAEDFEVQRAAQEQLNDERQNVIAQLSAIVSDPDNQARRRPTVTKAMRLLGDWRA